MTPDHVSAIAPVSRDPRMIAKASPRDIVRFCTPEAVEEVLSVWQEVIAELAAARVVSVRLPDGMPEDDGGVGYGTF